MHFATALVLSVLPSAFAAAVPHDDTEMINETFTNPAGEERTVQLYGAHAKRRVLKSPAGYKAPAYFPGGQAFQEKDEMKDHCGDSTFHNYSAEGAPDVGDCQCLMDYVKDRKGQWPVNARGDEFTPLVGCGTCTFGVKTKNIVGSIIGNTDMADVLRDAIRELPVDGQLAAEGDMGCWSIFDTARVDWAIFKESE